MASAAAVGALVAMVYHSHNIAAFAIWAVPLAIFAQMGDLFESAVKRKAGAKDSGTLIPGHGGLLDRVDGLLISSVVFALFYLFWGSYL
jgi:phosphatidate cytidylyltransferase